MNATAYKVLSLTEDGGEYHEGARTKLKDAFALARLRWREYKGAKVIEVRTTGGAFIANDPSEFTMRHRRYAIPFTS